MTTKTDRSIDRRAVAAGIGTGLTITALLASMWIAGYVTRDTEPEPATPAQPTEVTQPDISYGDCVGIIPMGDTQGYIDAVNLLCEQYRVSP